MAMRDHPRSSFKLYITSGQTEIKRVIFSLAFSYFLHRRLGYDGTNGNVTGERCEVVGGLTFSSKSSTFPSPIPVEWFGTV